MEQERIVLLDFAAIGVAVADAVVAADAESIVARRGVVGSFQVKHVDVVVADVVVVAAAAAAGAVAEDAV
jgi:hypothetical protein